MNAQPTSLLPLIKWSGGKRSEIPVLRPAYPQQVQRIIEPFAGGAAVSLDLNPGRAVLGDVSTDLVRFYQALGNAQVRDAVVERILQIQSTRKVVAQWVEALDDEQILALTTRALSVKLAQKSKPSGKSGGSVPLAGEMADDTVLPPGLIDQWVGHLRTGYDDTVLRQWLAHDIEASLRDKMARVDKLGRGRAEGAFNGAEFRPHVLTAIHAGVYTSLRRTYNRQPLIAGGLNTRSKKNKTPLTDVLTGERSTVEVGASEHSRNVELVGDVAWQVACWYVVRNLCYAGMFRFGPNGQFNVPYGGISYNSRDFSKVKQTLADPQVETFFQHTDVHLMDFDRLMDRYDNFGGMGSGDFIFLDPPYDSAFSQYNSEGDFTQHDQQRLAQRLRGITTPWMLVIKNTDFILSLYQDIPGQPPLYRALFDKSYQVNLRNRNDGQVEHLVVTNYPLPVGATEQGGGGLAPLP